MALALCFGSSQDLSPLSQGYPWDVYVLAPYNIFDWKGPWRQFYFFVISHCCREIRPNEYRIWAIKFYPLRRKTRPLSAQKTCASVPAWFIRRAQRILGRQFRILGKRFPRCVRGCIGSSIHACFPILIRWIQACNPLSRRRRGGSFSHTIIRECLQTVRKRVPIWRSHWSGIGSRRITSCRYFISIPTSFKRGNLKPEPWHQFSCISHWNSLLNSTRERTALVQSSYLISST